MPRKRSRPQTEEKFQHAVLELIAAEGCCGLGINAIAQIAGADKVLIYRYFGDLNGLLEAVAEDREWLPSADEVLTAIIRAGQDATSTLREIAKLITHHVRTDKATQHLLNCRRVTPNALTDHFSKEWAALWSELPQKLSEGLDHAERTAWAHASALTALIVEAELCNEAVDSSCIDLLSQSLQLGEIRINDTEAGHLPSATEAEEQLPTNLL